MAEPDPKELFRAFLTDLASGDSGISMDETLPGLVAFVEQFATPDFVCLMAGLPPTPPIVHPGIEGLAEGWGDYRDAFAGLRVRLIEIRESAEHIVAVVDQLATTRHGGVEISQPSAMVVAFEGHRVARVEFHLDRAAALRAAGLEA